MTASSTAKSWATSDRARATMRANRSTNTMPELAIRQILHRHGLRYRVNVRPIRAVRRSADVVFTKQRLAVFVDGCFWHGCPQHYVAPKQNVDYWSEKVRRNRERDAETTRLLEEAGWHVLRVWEHEAPAASAQRIEQARASLASHK
ncbi:very short patch repair endonuclease [Nocardioides sp. HM23]|uniref:very short patch repair endonuclease n=1 Tax=Nocardioides bizhenqiangii TaxID=3095076 RepID=UPI002ACAB8DC|nr:very short patch repair endonuclease [Nocardioides sp. HM23]MDZ5622049.1 very short patch repair endonuclease [Nocardioides sp. HM23]